MARWAKSSALVAVTAVAALVGTVAGLRPAEASAPSPLVQSSNQASSVPPSNCFWRGPAHSQGKYNAAFPDTAAVYWTAMFSLPAGSRLTLAGSYPHARYTSFNTYDASGVASDSINDVGITPAAGSTNPFQPGASRTDPQRSYSMSVLDQSPPVTRAANTLYAGISGQTTEVLIYRVYVPDQGSDLTGGVGLPQVSVTSADNSVLAGGKMCTAISASKSLPPSQSFPLSVYQAPRKQPGQPPTFPAQNPPTFWRSFNLGALVGCIYHASCGGAPALAPGQYSNLGNAYAVAMVNRGFGSVLVLHGKMPVTPPTYLQNQVAASRTQVRYWSLCQNESLATTKVSGCLYDEQVPADANGYYTIVTSFSKDRPSNATAACGVSWIPWPKKGDGTGHLDDGMLILRNMLSSPNFTSAIHDVTHPGTESAVMGDYLPTGQYTTKAAFQGLGCL